MSKPVKVVYTRVAEKNLEKLDKKTALRIVSKIYDNAHQTDILIRAKALTGRFAGKFRYRIGDYRVIFVFDDDSKVSILTVLHVAHRKDVYS